MRLELVFSEGDGDADIEITFAECFGDIFDEEGVVDIGVGDDKANGVVRILPSFEGGEDGIWGGTVKEGGGGSGEEGRESDFAKASAGPEVNGATEGKGSDLIDVGSGDGDLGGVNGEVDTFFPVVVPNEDGSGIDKWSLLSDGGGVSKAVEDHVSDALSEEQVIGL